jgi:hypothetical protein
MIARIGQSDLLDLWRRPNDNGESVIDAYLSWLSKRIAPRVVVQDWVF